MPPSTDVPEIGADSRLPLGAGFLLQPQHAALHLAGGGHGQGINKFDLFGVLVRRQPGLDMGLQRGHKFSIKLASSPYFIWARSCKFRSKHHIGFDHCATLFVWLGHHRGIDHGRVPDQAVLNFPGANAVAGGLEHIVTAALVPQVPLGIAAGGIIGEAIAPRWLLSGDLSGGGCECDAAVAGMAAPWGGAVSPSIAATDGAGGGGGIQLLSRLRGLEGGASREGYAKEAVRMSDFQGRRFSVWCTVPCRG